MDKINQNLLDSIQDDYKKQRPIKKSLACLRKNWAVAEMKITYRYKKRTGIRINNSYEANRVFREMWDSTLINVQEQFCTLFMNQANEVIGFRIISTGTLTSNTVDLQLLLSCALSCRCATIIIAHNHPSGKLLPSRNDKKLTWKIKDLIENFNFQLLDHLIISDEGFYSFADNEIIF